MMELRHLRYFTTVATEGNFTRAAEKLGIAQPPLSRQIRDLEDEVGVELLDRNHRPIRLTEPGRIFFEQALPILAGMDQLVRSVRHFASAQQRRFVIGVVGSIMHGALPDMIRRFRGAAADVEVELVELTTVEQVAALKGGRIDAGLGRVRIDDPAVRREILFNETLVAALSSTDPLAAGEDPVPLAALMERTVIIYPSQPRPSYADQLLSLFRDHGCFPAKTVEVREVQTALGLVAAGSGCAIVPESMRHLQRGDIVYRPLVEEAVSPVIISQRANDISESSRLFREIGRSVFDHAQH
jgi:DNA-binding transcriptional LysR family regulator